MNSVSSVATGERLCGVQSLVRVYPGPVAEKQAETHCHGVASSTCPQEVWVVHLDSGHRIGGVVAATATTRRTWGGSTTLSVSPRMPVSPGNLSSFSLRPSGKAVFKAQKLCWPGLFSHRLTLSVIEAAVWRRLLSWVRSEFRTTEVTSVGHFFVPWESCVMSITGLIGPCARKWGHI